ncbi:MAG: Enoyl-CoA hydratase/carnithine racemase [Clostridia bacterium 62_21]|nr:MAG: Enoyl-CoA hydratase/carnithine racemase [Clostridia bacterium 62_21]HAG07426.1 hypothetical protein [Peptococcaceae bacterium]
MNAVDPETARELVTALEQCRGESKIRVVIVTGSGGAFCAGGDLKYCSRFLGSNPVEPIRELTDCFHRIILDIRILPKPVIAAVNGVAAGGGMSLALACDLRIAAADAQFRQAYTGVGLVPDAGWSLWVSLLSGFGRASEMLFLDPVIDAGQALQMGLVHKVVAPGELAEETSRLGARLAEGPARAHALAKAALNRGLLGALEYQLEVERQGVLQAAGTRDFREGLTAFLEKRRPRFLGE